MKIGEMRPLTVSGARNALYLVPAEESDDGEPTVVMFSCVGSGSPERAHHSRWLGLGVVSPRVVPSALEECLESRAEVLHALAAQYEGTTWDGHNHVGHWSDALDEDVLYKLHDDLQDVETFWEASEWYAVLSHSGVVADVLREACAEGRTLDEVLDHELHTAAGMATLDVHDLRRELMAHAARWLEEHDDPEADEPDDAALRAYLRSWTMEVVR